MEYLNKDRLSQILDFLIKDIDYQNQDKPERAFKYPKVAADILSTNCSAIRDFFEFRNEEGKMKNFNKLFDDFLQPDGQVKGEMINVTRSSYVYRVI